METLEQLLKKFRQVVVEHREEYYHDICDEKARKLKMEKIIKLMGKGSISPYDICR